MSYAIDDFTETLSRTIDKAMVQRVVAAWGKGDGMGEDGGHYKHHEPGATDWVGGFLLALVDGRFAYISGWCDYTGWGCQDGATVVYFDSEPSLDGLNGDDVSEVVKAPPAEEWDLEPIDLNRWLSGDLKP